MSKFKPARVKDLLGAIEAMREEDLNLDAEVEVYVGDKLFHIAEMGHFHFVPNLTLTVREKGTQALSSAKALKSSGRLAAKPKSEDTQQQ